MLHFEPVDVELAAVRRTEARQRLLSDAVRSANNEASRHVIIRFQHLSDAEDMLEHIKATTAFEAEVVEHNKQTDYGVCSVRFVMPKVSPDAEAARKKTWLAEREEEMRKFNEEHKAAWPSSGAVFASPSAGLKIVDGRVRMTLPSE